MQLIGPFTQLLTMRGLPESGPIEDDQLEILHNAGILVHEGEIAQIGRYSELKKDAESFAEIEQPMVALPGFIDAHTHICFAGSRASDYALRVGGVSYQEIAAKGGGILDTVAKTRAASKEMLIEEMDMRCDRLLQSGVTTCEVKSGYGLNIEDEIKMLEAIIESTHPLTRIPTCLAAHTIPPEFRSGKEYLQHLIEHLFPLLLERKLTNRIDIFVEKGAFSVEDAKFYLKEAKKAGFNICVHADQFTRGGSQLAAKVGALSADHLEVSADEDARALKEAGVIPIVLPGASLGLGMPFPPARMLLDAGLELVIASDWNPGSAPMGNLLLQAAVLGAAEKLRMSETLAAITVRAARALNLSDRGILQKGARADLVLFPCSDYREILYHQGSLLPDSVFIQETKSCSLF